MDEAVAGEDAVDAAAHDDDAVAFGVQLGEEGAEGVVDGADELACLDFLQELDAGSEVAGHGGGHDFVHVAVADEVLGGWYRGGVACEHVEVVHDVEDALCETVNVFGAGAAGAGGFGVEAGHAEVGGRGDATAGGHGRWMAPKYGRAEDTGSGEGATAYVIIAVDIASQGGDVADDAGAVEVDEEVGGADELDGEPVGDALGEGAGLGAGEDACQIEAVDGAVAGGGGVGGHVADGDHEECAAESGRVDLIGDAGDGFDAFVLVAVDAGGHDQGGSRFGAGYGEQG